MQVLDVKGSDGKVFRHTNKWSTGYLKPRKLLKEELDLLELEDIKKEHLNVD